MDSLDRMGTSASAGRVSLKHVAARAGVSVKTVSNVVNRYPHISEETRARVQQAIDELDYRPNLVARNLRRGRSNVIALALPAQSQSRAAMSRDAIRMGGIS